MGQQRELIDHQSCVDHLIDDVPLAFLVAAQRGAAYRRARGELSNDEEDLSDLVETIIAFRIGEGLTL